MKTDKRISAVIVAAGKSMRMGAGKSKVLLPIARHPAIWHTIKAFEKCGCIYDMVIVCREEDVDEISVVAAEFSKVKAVIIGGEERQDSVSRGVERVIESDFFAIHDGARPMISHEIIEKVCEAAMLYGSSCAAVPAKDTYKVAGIEGFISSTPDRSSLWAAQTPQVFEKELYLEALETAKRRGEKFTDDCQLVELVGGKVYLCESDYKNIKLTTYEDILFADALMGGNDMRVGYGYDVHRLCDGRKMILGGVEIPYEKGLLGHSDADVLAHAISDALLGAAALGDIGRHFPDTDERYKGADSLKLLSIICRILRDEGYEIGNIDSSIIAQKPKLAPYIDEMRKRLADACSIDKSRIGIKAKTEEGLGFTGEEKGIAASAVVMIR